VIVDTFLGLKTGGAIDFDEMFETLFEWSKNWIKKRNRTYTKER